MGALGGVERGRMQRRHQSSTCIVSDLILLMGYCMVVMGVVSPAWRFEIGYTYGLWVRCDEGVCFYFFIGFRSYLAVVQSCIITSLLLLTTSTICILLEGIMRACRIGKRHVTRTSNMVIVTAAVGEILAAFSLGFYGGQTVMAMERLPALGSGFALTGVGVIVSLIGNILKAMGPPESWGDGMCCLAPKMQHFPVNYYSTGTPDFPPAGKHRGSRSRNERQTSRRKDAERVGLISCFHDNKNGYSYSSVPSTISSTFDKGYRHYEEISFEDMPPPPQEMLNQYQPVGPSFHYQHDPIPAHPPQEHILYDRNPNLDQRDQSDVALQHMFLESNAYHQQYTDGNTISPDYYHERQSRQPGVVPPQVPQVAPQVAPRHQHRTVIRSTQRHHTSTTNDSPSTFYHGQ